MSAFGRGFRFLYMKAVFLLHSFIGEITMTHRSSFASGLLALALALPVAASAQHGGRIELPQMPQNFEVQEGNVPFLQTHAYGTQQYICLPTGWKQFTPQATLYPQNAPMQVATHFLSTNPQDGVARPTWQDAHDGSAVWGKVFGLPLTDPNYVAQGAVPWLLLEAAGTATGPIGGEVLAKTTFIHRVNTEGGVAPAGACTVGAVALVPYTADYYFYRQEK
jgi:hypothetical protein